MLNWILLHAEYAALPNVYDGGISGHGVSGKQQSPQMPAKTGEQLQV